MSGNFHENLEREALPLPSDRSTGLVFTVVALIVAYLWRNNETVLYSALAIAAGFSAVSLLIPRILRPLNILWMRFALVLSKIVNPIVMLVLFAIAIVPAGLLMQIGYDPLRRKRSDDNGSYWIERESSLESSMRNQF
jgi:hypothetical protein